MTSKKLVVYSPDSTKGLEQFLEQDIIFVNNLKNTFIKDDSNMNCDCILFLDSGNDLEYFKLKSLYKNVLGIPRLSKCNQILFLKQFNINYPESFFSNNNIFTNNSLANILKEYNDDKKLVVKIDNGARGLGQMLLSKKDLILFSNSSNDEIDVLKEHFKEKNDESGWKLEPMPTKDQNKFGYVEGGKFENIDKIQKEFDENVLHKFKDIKFSNNEFHSFLFNSLFYSRGSKNEIIIQNYIPNRIEYRILWFYKNDPIVIRREISADNWQANACGNPENKSYVVSDNIIKFTLKSILDQINNLALFLKVPFLSIDVYYDLDTDKYGIFEFQIEFGWSHTQNLDSRQLNSLIVSSTKTLIDDNVL